MKLAWNFNKVNPRFKNREATQGEFFTNDTELRGFVREAVQNSLDARRPRVKGPVRVRIFISGDKAALLPEKAARYFQGGWEHFKSEGCGLKDAPSTSERCRFITYEDSGTTGLTGDVSQYHEVPGVRNPFYYFFRAEGQSNKTEGGRGRWGLGKFVFPRSSRIRSFFGVTVRHDDRKRILVGQSILRSHHVGAKSFTPDGWFGKKPGGTGAALPVTDQRFIKKFEADFRLKRDKDPGLSIVIPFCDNRWTSNAVIESIVQDYFHPILSNGLVVTVEDADSKIVINAQSLPTVVNKCSESVRHSIEPLLTLTTWGLEQQQNESIVVLNGVRSSVNRKSVTDADFNAMKDALQLHGRVAVRLPAIVQLNGGAEQSTYFDAFIQRAEGAAQKRPIFVRDGIVISDVRTRLIRDVHAIVTIDDAPLTALLGDAENPAHTEWSEESSHFKGKYINGSATLRFMRNAVIDLCQMLCEVSDDDDQELLLNVFSLGTQSGEAGLPVNFASMTSRGGENNLLRLKAMNGKPRRSKPFRVTNRKGGFRVAGRTKSADWLAPIEVVVAYDCRSGAPLRKYATSDFQLDKEPITIKTQNAMVQVIKPNHLIIFPQSSQFDVTVTGFDLNRDLFVQARASDTSTRSSRRAA